MFPKNRLVSLLVRSGVLAVALGACTGQGGYHGYVPAAGDGGLLPANSDLTVASGPDLATPLKAAYPEGPYGNKIDDTMTNLKLQGFRLSVEDNDVSKLTWDTNIQIADYYNNKACKCLLITWGATWCGACNQEQPALVADVSSDPNFCVLNILQEGPAQGPDAKRSDVDAWIKRYNQNFYIVQGSAQTRAQWQGHGPTIGLPFNFVVETKGMKIVDVINGYRQDIHQHAMSLCGG